MSSKTPLPPDFAAMEALAPSSADQRTYILALIGNLNFSWSNNESMFIYLLMALLETDLQAAAITFATLNTTRARLDLVRRLAKTKISDPKLLAAIERVITRFNQCTKLRNELNHCIYHINDEGRFTHMTILRISESKTGIKVGYDVQFDKRKINQIITTAAKLKDINREIWTLMPILEKAMGAKSATGTASPA